ncbi:helix-turn-helix transcriptional regulator [Deinococcus deserti]|uniref:Putative Transcriptional regulator, XRE family n=1 Tax=Deinococcus deserti (strain DSM 17065 / CIP 109153 / LMG 22923 / VCD115) TaxID=546414 RepID=C1CZ62_DEIDV|nr:helix-turn-helix transcriptional regulator [Deinococcus deserti]ACO45100.1 putative Transcriptional regulator, XRE family [Deinococcus deserti VCD115]
MPARKPQPTDPLVQEVRIRVGQRIRELRLAKGMNQDEFAAAAGIHRTHPGKLENAQIDPQLSTLVKVASALGVRVDELLT